MTSSTSQLGELVQIIAGQHIEASLHNDDPNGTPYLTGPADFGITVPVISKWTTAPKVFATSSDVLVTVKGAGVGKSNLGCNAAIGRQLMALRPIEHKIDQYYLFYFLRYKEKNIASLADGATVPGIGKDDLATLCVPSTSLNEQRRIAAILDKADALRRKRNRVTRLAASSTQAFFIETFGNSEKIAARWDKHVSLSGIADISSGITKGRKQPTGPLRSVPYLAVANVQDHALELSAVKSIDASEEEIQKLRLKNGDLVLTEGGDPDKLGRGTIWRDEIPEAIHQNHIFRVRPVDSNIDENYLMHLIGSRYGKNYFLKAAKQTTGIASINKTQLSDFSVPLPPIALQKQFAVELDRLGDVKRRADQASSTMDALFVSLQHRAFTGQL